MIFAEIDYVGSYGITTPKNSGTTKERAVIMFEINFCIEDGGIIYIGDKAIPIKKNTIICAKPGQKRHTKHPMKCYSISFDTKNNNVQDILLNLPDGFTVKNGKEYIEIFTSARKHFVENSDDSKLMLESLILKLIYRLKRDSTDVSFFDGTPAKQAETIKAAVKYIKEHLNEDLSLEALSKKFSFSPTYFHNSFKDVMQKTPRLFVEERRIKKSIDLLLTTDTPISEIAYECGFTSQSYFCYAFKRYTGTTPKKYVKSFIKEHEK